MAGVSTMSGRVQDGRRAVRLDAWLVIATVILLLMGFMSLYSEGLEKDHLLSFRKQLINGAIGLIPFGIFATVNPRVWQRLAHPIYILNLVMLMGVLVVGKSAKGAARWIDIGPIQFQPSELAKLLVVLTLASFYAARSDRITELSTFLLGLVHAIVPALMIFKQPHLGAFCVVMVTWFAVSLVAQVPAKYLGAFALIAITGAGTVLFVPKVRDRVLDDYQVDRLLGFMDSRDLKKKNWQTYRAEIAFGVGGVSGTGFGNGLQKKGGFIPEQRNDFIFTVVGEEGGLVGASLVLLAFAFFFYRIFVIMHLATEPFYRMLAAGVFAVLGAHTLVNIAMVLRVAPVVGLWLPFLSYGGTALWLCMACVGLLLNIRSREKPILF